MIPLQVLLHAEVYSETTVIDSCLGFRLIKLGECLSIDEAEIWGIYHGMKIARKYDIWGIYHGMKIARRYDIWGLYRDILRQHSIPISAKIARQHDFGKIIVESGSEKASGFVLDGCPTSTSLEHCFPLCDELKALTSATNHLYFDNDYAADSFAKFGLSMKRQPVKIFRVCPPFCQPYISEYR